MTHQEFTRLRTIQNSMKRAFRPAVRVFSRRSAKHPHVGKVLKNSRVIPQVGLEVVFNHISWKHLR